MFKKPPINSNKKVGLIVSYKINTKQQQQDYEPTQRISNKSKNSKKSNSNHHKTSISTNSPLDYIIDNNQYQQIPNLISKNKQSLSLLNKQPLSSSNKQNLQHNQRTRKLNQYQDINHHHHQNNHHQKTIKKYPFNSSQSSINQSLNSQIDSVSNHYINSISSSKNNIISMQSKKKSKINSFSNSQQLYQNSSNISKNSNSKYISKKNKDKTMEKVIAVGNIFRYLKQLKNQFTLDSEKQQFSIVQNSLLTIQREILNQQY